jgi:tetratricopeptide (TPR) repeat protein
MRREPSWVWTLSLGICLTLAIALSPRVHEAQLAPKRSVGGGGASCPAQSAAAAPGAQRRASAREAFLQGQEAAIGGDNRVAREHFQRAAEQDPSDAAIAYQLARAHESLGEVNEAIREYCRLLAIAPGGPDAPEAQQRLSELGPRRSQSEIATVQFRAGLRQIDETRWRDAQVAFTRAIEAAPDWPESYYNRAIVLERLDQNERATADYQRYLELEPAAADRDVVVRRMVSLRRRNMSPGSALARGLLVPGLGQHYTRRPVLGFLVLGAVGGAIAYGVVPKDVEITEVRTGTFIDPFGNEREYEYDYTYFERQRPNLTAGIAAAAAISALAALEAYNHARSATAAPRTESRLTPLIDTDWATSETRVGVTIRF